MKGYFSCRLDADLAAREAAQITGDGFQSYEPAGRGYDVAPLWRRAMDGSSHGWLSDGRWFIGALKGA